MAKLSLLPAGQAVVLSGLLALALVAGPGPAAAYDLNQLQDDTQDLLNQGGDALNDAGDAAGRALGHVERSIDQAVADPMAPSAGWLASDLIGAAVRDDSGERIAVVSDLVVGEDAEVPLAILRVGGHFGAGGQLRAIEFPRLAPIPGTPHEAPEFRMSPQELEGLPAWRIRTSQ